MSIINETPLGKHKTEVAIKVFEAMLINGMLFNSDAQHVVTQDGLEQISEALLRGILTVPKQNSKGISLS